MVIEVCIGSAGNVAQFKLPPAFIGIVQVEPAIHHDNPAFFLQPGELFAIQQDLIAHEPLPACRSG